jgi:hypothetical protein
MVDMESEEHVHSGPTTLSTNVLVIPSLNGVKCEKCGNDDINPYRDLDSYTFDIICNSCNSTIWENPEREERMQQINDMLDS